MMATTRAGVAQRSSGHTVLFALVLLGASGVGAAPQPPVLGPIASAALPSAFWYSRSNLSSVCGSSGVPGRPGWPLYLFSIPENGTVGNILYSVGRYYCSASNEYSLDEPARICDIPPSATAAKSLDGGITWECLPKDVPTSLLRVGVSTWSGRFGYGLESEGTCLVMCVMGGIILQGSGEAERSLLCSTDGTTWNAGPSFPTTVVRASGVQGNPISAFVAGGIRGDNSTDLRYIIITPIDTVCTLRMFWYAANAAPTWGVRAHPLLVTQLPQSAWNPSSAYRVVVAGGVRPAAADSPAVVLSDIYVCVECETLQEFILAPGSGLPVGAQWDAGSTTMLGWGGAGLADTPFEEQCYNKSRPELKCLILMLNDRMFLSSSTGSDVVWQSMDQVLPAAGLPATPPRTLPAGYTLRSAIIVPDTVGQTSIVGYKTGTGTLSVVLPLPCVTTCEPGAIHNGCMAGPMDAVCAPCASCQEGDTFAVDACAIKLSPTGVFGAETLCSACTVCGTSLVEVQACNATHDAVCGVPPNASDSIAQTDAGQLLACVIPAVLVTAGAIAVHLLLSAAAERLPSSKSPSMQGARSRAQQQAVSGLPLLTAAATVTTTLSLACLSSVMMSRREWAGHLSWDDSRLPVGCVSTLWGTLIMGVLMSSALWAAQNWDASSRGTAPVVPAKLGAAVAASASWLSTQAALVGLSALSMLHPWAMAYRLQMGGDNGEAMKCIDFSYKAKPGTRYNPTTYQLAMVGTLLLEIPTVVVAVLLLSWHPPGGEHQQGAEWAMAASRAQDVATIRATAKFTLAVHVTAVLLCALHAVWVCQFDVDVLRKGGPVQVGIAGCTRMSHALYRALQSQPVPPPAPNSTLAPGSAAEGGSGVSSRAARVRMLGLAYVGPAKGAPVAPVTRSNAPLLPALPSTSHEPTGYALSAVLPAGTLLQSGRWGVPGDAAAPRAHADVVPRYPSILSARGTMMTDFQHSVHTSPLHTLNQAVQPVPVVPQPWNLHPHVGSGSEEGSIGSHNGAGHSESETDRQPNSHSHSIADPTALLHRLLLGSSAEAVNGGACGGEAHARLTAAWHNNRPIQVPAEDPVPSPEYPAIAQVLSSSDATPGNALLASSGGAGSPYQRVAALRAMAAALVSQLDRERDSNSSSGRASSRSA